MLVAGVHRLRLLKGESKVKLETIIALKGSIDKWKAIVAGTGKDYGGRNCPLCELFARGGKDCRGCPVKTKTRRMGCVGSPWETWALAQTLSRPWRANTPERLKLARAELKFLRSLLPKRKAPRSPVPSRKKSKR